MSNLNVINDHHKTSWWLDNVMYMTSTTNRAQGSVSITFFTWRSDDTATHCNKKKPSADSRVKLWFLHAKKAIEQNADSRVMLWFLRARSASTYGETTVHINART